jgi:hypothetical protein
MTMGRPFDYRLTIGMNSGKPIVSEPMRLDEAARVLAAHYEEGQQDVFALVGDERRPATSEEQARLIARTRMYTAK